MTPKWPIFAASENLNIFPSHFKYDFIFKVQEWKRKSIIWYPLSFLCRICLVTLIRSPRKSRSRLWELRARFIEIYPLLRICRCENARKREGARGGKGWRFKEKKAREMRNHSSRAHSRARSGVRNIPREVKLPRISSPLPLRHYLLVFLSCHAIAVERTATAPSTTKGCK